MKPNKQKTDWEKIEKIVEDIMQCGFEVAMGGDMYKDEEENKKLQEEKYNECVAVFTHKISKTLQQQREDFKQTMANSNEWWNNKLRQQREEIIKEIEGIVGEDEKLHRMFWDSDIVNVEVKIRNELRKEIRERLKQITN